MSPFTTGNERGTCLASVPIAPYLARAGRPWDEPRTPWTGRKKEDEWVPSAERALAAERSDSELRFRPTSGAWEGCEQPSTNDDSVSPRGDDEEPATLRVGVGRPSFGPIGSDGCDKTDALSARSIARLSALADWMEGEEPVGVVVPLVRAFLRDVNGVTMPWERSWRQATASAAPELGAVIRSLALAIGLWRSDLVEHVDDLALSNYRSFVGWSSLPEYSSAYVLAIVRPALAEAEAWVTAAAVELAPLVRAVGASVDRLNATLRGAMLGSSGPSYPAAGRTRSRAFRDRARRSHVVTG